MNSGRGCLLIHPAAEFAFGLQQALQLRIRAEQFPHPFVVAALVWMIFLRECAEARLNDPLDHAHILAFFRFPPGNLGFQIPRLLNRHLMQPDQVFQWHVGISDVAASMLSEFQFHAAIITDQEAAS